MRIAYVSDTVYPWVKGGIQKRVYELSRRLVRRGHEVHWFGLQWWDGDTDTLLDGIHLHGVGRWSNLYVKERRSAGEGLYFGLKTLAKLRGDFDIIDAQHAPYFHCFSARIHSSLRGSSLVITWHSVWRDYWLEYIGKWGYFGQLVEILTAKLTEHNVAVSGRVKKDLERIGVRGEVEVIPNGVDIGRISSLRASSKESDVIFTGRLVREKNVELLLRALRLIRREFPDVKCLIIGEGPERGRLEKLVRDLELEGNVEFLGFLDNDVVLSYMKSSKVFVLPSIREGLSVAAMEANACGLPVVTVNHKGNATAEFIVNEKNGFVAEPSERDLAEKILLSLSMWKDMRWKCIEHVQKYDWENITRMVELFYSKVT